MFRYQPDMFTILYTQSGGEVLEYQCYANRMIAKVLMTTCSTKAMRS